MARAIRIEVDKKTGKVKWDFDGFVGEACFAEAEKLRRLLRERFGINVEVEEIVEKPEARISEVEEEKQVIGW